MSAISSPSKKHYADDVLESPSPKRQKTTDTRLKVAAKFKDLNDDILQSICLFIEWPDGAKNAAQTCKDLNRAVKFCHNNWETLLSKTFILLKYSNTVTLQKTLNFMSFNIYPCLWQRGCFPEPKKFNIKNILPIMTFDYFAGVIIDTPSCHNPAPLGAGQDSNEISDYPYPSRISSLQGGVPQMNESFNDNPNIKKVARGAVFNAEKIWGCLVHTIKKDNLQKDYGLFLKLDLMRQIKYTFSEENQKYFPNTLAICEDMSQVDIFQEKVGEMSFFEIFSSNPKSIEIPIEKRFKLANCVVNGLALLHHQSITHRDLFPSNILVNRSMDKAFIVGFRSLYKTTRDQNGGKIIHAGKKFATHLDFLPPEFIKAYVDAEDEQHMDYTGYPLLGDQASDIWQLGINFAYLFGSGFCGIPLDGVKREEYLSRLEHWKKCHFEISIRNNDPLGHLILTMLSENPKDRPSIGTISNKLIEIAKEKWGIELKPVVFDEPDADAINDTPDADPPLIDSDIDATELEDEN